MEIEFDKTFFISANESNPESELAVHILIGNIIEVATAHANHLGIGNPQMEDLNAGWVLSRFTVEMSSYPKVNTYYKIITWVEDFNSHFSIRNFEIQDLEGNTFGYSRSIWMVLNTMTHENFGLAHLNFEPEWISQRPCPIARQAKHLEIMPMYTPEAEMPPRAIRANHRQNLYSFKYNDIDFYRHVNTVRYAVLLLNNYSINDFDTCFVRRLEMSFLHEAKFGNVVDIRRHDSSELNSEYLMYDLSASRPVVFARIGLEPRK